eukprot:COSAG02_NODE_6414_length_3587_cov_2.185493_2_plen_70_part_00
MVLFVIYYNTASLALGFCRCLLLALAVFCSSAEEKIVVESRSTHIVHQLVPRQESGTGIARVYRPHCVF